MNAYVLSLDSTFGLRMTVAFVLVVSHLPRRAWHVGSYSHGRKATVAHRNIMSAAVRVAASLVDLW